jgi:hypothetical protein
MYNEVKLRRSIFETLKSQIIPACYFAGLFFNLTVRYH